MSSPWAAGASTWQPRAICYAGPAALSNTRWRGCYPPNQLGGLAGPPSFCEAVLNLCRSATLGLPRAPLVARQSLGRPSRLTTGPPSLFPVGSQSRSWRRLFRKPWRGAKARFLARRAPFWTWHLGQPELAASGICPPAAKGEPPSRLRVRCLPRSTAARQVYPFVFDTGGQELQWVRSPGLLTYAYREPEGPAARCPDAAVSEASDGLGHSLAATVSAAAALISGCLPFGSAAS
jgi:hypothetical protein